MTDTTLLAYSAAELAAELTRRQRAIAAGLCDACGAWHEDPTCGSPRHGDAASVWYRRWQFEWGSGYLTAHRLGGERTYVSVSRYGTDVRLFTPAPEIYPGCMSSTVETDLPVDFTNDHPRSNLNDEERLRWAIDWAISQLDSAGEAGDQ